MATSNSVKLHKLRKLIAWLSSKEGKGMEFVSLYIPSGVSIEAVVTSVKKDPDCSVAKPEDVKEVKDHLQATIKSVIEHLKMQKEISGNGLAMFAGAFAASNQGTEVFNVEEIAPPEPITTYLYEVDDHFHLEPLREMLRNQKVVGFVAIDSKEASFGVLNGERLELLENITSGIHGKSGKGGSSQRRYERERDTELTHYFHRIAEHAAKEFLENNKIAALIIGGPGTTKEDFLKGNYLHYELNNALLETVDTQSAGKEAIKEMLDKSAETRKNMCAPQEKIVMQRLLTAIGKQDNLATYGLDPVLNALKNGSAEVALLTDTTDMVEIVAMCKKCKLAKTTIVEIAKKVQTMQEMISTPCERCRAVEYEMEEKDIVDVLEDVASQTDAIVEVISSESEEKAKLRALGGFAAILRYKSR